MCDGSRSGSIVHVCRQAIRFSALSCLRYQLNTTLYLSLSQQWQCTPPAMWCSDAMASIYCRPVNTVRGLFHPVCSSSARPPSLISHAAVVRAVHSLRVPSSRQQLLPYTPHVKRSAVVSSRCSLIMSAYTNCRRTVFLPSIQVIQRCGYGRYHYRVPLGTDCPYLWFQYGMQNSRSSSHVLPPPPRRSWSTFLLIL
jgi:hypothetical protein